jgi:hypothetical protein
VTRGATYRLPYGHWSPVPMVLLRDRWGLDAMDVVILAVALGRANKTEARVFFSGLRRWATDASTTPERVRRTFRKLWRNGWLRQIRPTRIVCRGGSTTGAGGPSSPSPRSTATWLRRGRSRRRRGRLRSGLARTARAAARPGARSKSLLERALSRRALIPKALLPRSVCPKSLFPLAPPTAETIPSPMTVERRSKRTSIPVRSSSRSTGRRRRR